MRTVRPLVVAAAVLCLVMGTAACSEDPGLPAAAPSASTPGATGFASPPLTPDQLAAVVVASTRDLNRAARQFNRCENGGVAGYGFNSCWPKARDAARVAGDFAGLLRAAQPPATYAMLQGRLDSLAATEQVIRKGCSKGDDQTCDLALMRFRDGVQKVSWELDLL